MNQRTKKQVWYCQMEMAWYYDEIFEDGNTKRTIHTSAEDLIQAHPEASMLMRNERVSTPRLRRSTTPRRRRQAMRVPAFVEPVPTSTRTHKSFNSPKNFRSSYKRAYQRTSS